MPLPPSASGPASHGSSAYLEGDCRDKGADIAFLTKIRESLVLLSRGGSAISKESELSKFVDTGEGSRRDQVQDLGIAFTNSHQVGFVLRPLAGPT